MVASVGAKPALTASSPRLAFEGPFVNVPGYSYAIHPDGERFLMIQESTPTNAHEIRLVFNWFEELRRIR